MPDPAELPYSPDEWEWIYGLWLVWRSTGKRYLPSQLIQEYLSGYGRVLDGLMDMESFYGKTLEELKPKKPNQ